MYRVCAVMLAAVSLALGGDPAFSDPLKQPPAPKDAAGYPSRDAALDVLPGFMNPPPGYGEVAFYWWMGDPLTKERIAWQLDQLQGNSISGLQVNYAHSADRAASRLRRTGDTPAPSQSSSEPFLRGDKGGLKWGLTCPGGPPLFTEPWWDLFGWFLKEARKRGMAVSLSDYTLGPGQGRRFDEIIRENPQMRGAALERTIRTCKGHETCALETPEDAISIYAYRLRNGAIVPGSGVDLRKHTHGRALDWRAPEGDWQIVAVYAVRKEFSLDPMHALSGRKLIEKFFQPFEDRNPGESGMGLNFFFSDELDFGVRGLLWNADFASEFRKRKRYDIVRELPALFVDTGPRAPKVRLDYSDVMVSLEEERFFRPVYDWHRSRGMLFGCDHGGRGKDVTEFGDYFRTQRWMTGPGADQPMLASDVIKNKVASSIAHLYERPRTWLEGYHSSGWGTTPAELTDATLRNFAMGQNLLTLHGLCYSTHGGWWEWAPPCNHFCVPYWAHMGEFLRMTERLSYLLSQGVHRADVAIVYPVAPAEADMGGKQAVEAAFTLGERLYERGIDFDFIDFESLARAKAETGRRLEVAGEEYRVLVLPSMRAVRHSTLEKALEFQRAGGLVIALGSLPEASDRSGRDDGSLQRMVRDMFGSVTTRAATPEQVEDRITQAFPRDFVCHATDPAMRSPYVQHRLIGSRDVYFVYGAPKDSVCTFRQRGRVEIWNPWTGGTKPLRVLAQTQGGGTRIRMPLEATEPQIIVFAPGKPLIDRAAPRQTRTIALEGPWEFELKPTLDNRFGDFRLPATGAMIGAEARTFAYWEEDQGPNGKANPRRVMYDYGPRFWKLGPLPETDEAAAIEAELARAARIDAASPVTAGGKKYSWEPYEYSLRFGVNGDPGHQGYHGLEGEMTGEFIALGRRKDLPTTTAYEREPGGTRYLLWTSVVAPRAGTARIVASGMMPARVWVNGAAVAGAGVALNGGANPMLVRYDGPGRGRLAVEQHAGEALMFDTRPQEQAPAGWYRFVAPPGLEAMTITARGTVRVRAGGNPVTVTGGRAHPDGAREYRATVNEPAAGPMPVEMRVEQERGWYGGAALPEPVLLECGRGELDAGDWSRIDGLWAYSGGAWYRKTAVLPDGVERGQVVLNLGAVGASAEVHVNGRKAGVKVAPPWKVDITDFVKGGENRVEILVYNTLANHYRTIPTRYGGSGVSGLLGPVAIELR